MPLAPLRRYLQHVQIHDKLKKRFGPVSRVLLPKLIGLSPNELRPSVIYLGLPSPTASICLPVRTSLRAQALRASRASNPRGCQHHKGFKQPIRIYMAFQPARFTRTDRYRPEPCALTARFHPYRKAFRRLFSVALAVEPASRFPHPLGGAALYVARTFLRWNATRDRAARNVFSTPECSHHNIPSTQTEMVRDI